MKTPAELEAAVRGYQSGDQEKFDSVYRLSHKYLYVCISHLVKDEDAAKDMLQETYLEITKSISQLQDPADFLSWAAVIARRRCYAFYQKTDRLVLSGEDEDGQDLLESIADDEAFIPESILQDREKSRLIREIIDGLSDMQRFCVIAFYFNEQKQEEIAEELGIPVNTVKSHLNRAKAKIKAEILTLEREKDTKLYTLAPFMLLFFAEEAEACEEIPMSEEQTDTAETDSDSSRFGRLSQLGMKTKILIGMIVLIGAASVIGVILSRSAREEQAEPEEQAQTQPQEETVTQEAELEETAEEPAEEEPEETETTEEETEEPRELAISGKYDQLGQGRDGIIVVCSGDKWGLVTYDDEVLVPIVYDHACTAPNDEGQTFFGNEGDYKVFDRDGNEIFQTDRPIKAVSEGVVLWVQAVEDTSYDFGYVALDGTTLYESVGEEIDGQAGAVGFQDGYAFFSIQGTEYRIAKDGSLVDIFEKREVLRHPELLEMQPVSSTVGGSGTSSDTNFANAIGACFEGYYVDRGIAYFEDTADLFYVFDAEGEEQYPIRIAAAAEYAGYPYVFGVDGPSWNVGGFYHNGNYCFSNGTKVAVSLTYGGETKAYLLDAAKLGKVEDGGVTQVRVTDESVLAEGEYIGIADTAYWLFQKDGRWGYIDQSGAVVQMFDDAARFYGGTAMAIEEGYAFFLDEEMNPSEWKIPAQSVSGYGEVFAVETGEGQKCYAAQ